MNLSLSRLLLGLWLAFLLVCFALAALMGGMYQLGIDAQVDHVRTRVDHSADLITRRFQVYTSSFAQPPADFADEQRRRELNLILGLVLADHKGVEGGFWTPDAGFVAYAFPTYEGEAKTDVPEAEKGRLTQLLKDVDQAKEAKGRQFDSKSESLIMRAAPAGPAGLAIWTMARAHVEEAVAHQKLMMGFLALFGFAVVSGTALLWFFHRWSGKVRELVSAIDEVPADELPVLQDTGVHELDRLVRAINRLNARNKESRQQMSHLTAMLARAERMTALGRMAAGVAHEVRNPIAAMRLKAENALAKSDAHCRAALILSLQEIGRLDELLERLLAMTRLETSHASPIDLKHWVHEQMENLAEQALQQGVRLVGNGEAKTVIFDGNAVGRAVHNLLLNALQHTPNGGWVKLTAAHDEVKLIIVVEDSGPGVEEGRRETIFEPFITSRPDGSGLGLNIARQLVEAQGGSIRCVEGTAGARFEIELPCLRS